MNQKLNTTLTFNHLNIQRPSERKPEAKRSATWEGVEVVEYWQQHFEIKDKGAFGKTYYYRQIKKLGITMYQARKIIEIMDSRKLWVKNTYGENMHSGKWLVNKFKEMKEVGVDGFISKNS